MSVYLVVVANVVQVPFSVASAVVKDHESTIEVGSDDLVRGFDESCKSWWAERFYLLACNL